MTTNTDYEKAKNYSKYMKAGNYYLEYMKQAYDFPY
jgi:hypothetical protein